MPSGLKGRTHTKDEVKGFRVIVCVDVDCFEEQVWRKHRYRHYPDNTPIVIVNLDDVVVSFNYSARAPKYEISREMSKVKLSKILLKHPELSVLPTGTRYGRCDTFTPFKESDLILNALMREVTKHGDVVVERASCDEVFLDITDALLTSWDWEKCASHDRLWNTKKHYPCCKEHDGSPKTILYSATITGQDIHNRTGTVEDLSEEALIIQGGIFSELLLDAILKETGYYCSAGVGPTKLIAKVASDFNKPAGVAMMTTKAFIRQTSSLPYDKLPGLKRKSGDEMRDFYKKEMHHPLKFVSQIQELSMDQLCKFYHGEAAKHSVEKAKTLYDRVRGIDSDPVQHKPHDNCMGFTYKFRGTHRAKERDVKDIANDMAERLRYLDEHQRLLPEYLLLRIAYKIKDSAREIKKVLYANREQQKNSRVLQDFIHDFRIKNDVDLGIVELFQFRAMNLKPFT